MRYWNIYSPTEILPQVARYWRALRLSADRATGAPGHTRGKGRRLGAASPAPAKFTAETDSLVEGDGFEPSVPRERNSAFRDCPEEELTGVEIRVDPMRLEEALEREHLASGEPKHGSGPPPEHDRRQLACLTGVAIPRPEPLRWHRVAFLARVCRCRAGSPARRARPCPFFES
jgi:hypothetical protein